MGTQPGIAQLFEKDRMRFPGMIPEETLVWRGWLAQHEQEFDAFEYNYRLGMGDDIGPNYSDAGRASAILNSKLRVDAICWKGITGYKPASAEYPPPEVYALFPQAQATIVEVKRRAATAAATQMATYGHVWVSEFPSHPKPFLVVAAASYSPTVTPALVGAGIRLDVIPTDFSGLRLPRHRK